MVKNIKIALLLLFMLALVVVSIVFNNKDSESTIELKSFEFKDRISYVSKEELIVGNNEKEILNNYYDFKIKLNVKYIDVYLNKLWVEHDSEDIIETDYLNAIISYCEKITNFNKELVTIKIIEMYRNVKKLKKEVVEKYTIDNLEFYEEDNQLVLRIYEGE